MTEVDVNKWRIGWVVTAYPLAIVYVSTAFVLMGFSNGEYGLGTALALIGIVSVLVFLATVNRNMRIITGQMAEHVHELEQRVVDLTTALQAVDAPVPTRRGRRKND